MKDSYLSTTKITPDVNNSQEIQQAEGNMLENNIKDQNVIDVLVEKEVKVLYIWGYRIF